MKRFVSLILLLLLAFEVNAASKIALVVGNSAYPNSPLSSPALDAKDMTSKLQELGYQVDIQTNVDRKAMIIAIRSFADKLKSNPGASGFFYYSGHGMQIDGRNYLIPVDADIQTEVDVQLNAIDVNEVMVRMKSSSANPNIIVLDACRNNPFEKRFKGGGEGLAKQDVPPGVLVAFAAAPGAVAPQAIGKKLSPYTAVLLEQLSEPIPAILLFNAVSFEISKRSAGSQRPNIDSTGIDPNFYLTAPKAVYPSKGSGKTGASSLSQRKVTTELSIEFIRDASTISPNNRINLENFAKSILSKDIQLEVVVVVGHADALGSDSYQQTVSEMRANAVKDMLENLGVPRNRVYTEGKGKTQPITGTSCGRIAGPKTAKNTGWLNCISPDNRVEMTFVGVSSF